MNDTRPNIPNIEIAQRLYPKVPFDPAVKVDPDLSWRIFRYHDTGEKFEAEPLMDETFTDWQVGGETFIDTGDQIVVAVRVRCRGRSSGVVIEDRHFSVLTIRDGELLECQQYWDMAEALRAVGL